MVQAAQEAADLLQTGDFVTDSNSPNGEADLLPTDHPAPVFDEARAEWHATAVKPFHRALRDFRRAAPMVVAGPPEERQRLLRTIGDLQDELAAIVQTLREAE